MNTVKSKNKDEQSINSYLLGQGTEEEQKSIEDRYFRDADFYEQILAQEDELIHDYLKGHLSASRKILFEKHFLHSERRHQKYLFVKSLISYADEHYMPQSSVAVAESRMSRWVEALKTMLTPQMIAMASAAMLLVTLSAAFLSYKYREARPAAVEIAAVKPVEKSPTAPSSIVPEPQTPVSPDNRQASPDSGATARKSASDSGGKESRGLSRLIASMPAFVFSSGVVRGVDASNSGSEVYPVNFASSTPMIRMDVHLPEHLAQAGSPTYEVVIKTLEAREVFRLVNVKPVTTPTGLVIQFPIHTALLDNGEYVLYVNSPQSIGELKPVSEMFFHVIRF